MAALYEFDLPQAVRENALVVLIVTLFSVIVSALALACISDRVAERCKTLAEYPGNVTGMLICLGLIAYVAQWAYNLSRRS